MEGSFWAVPASDLESAISSRTPALFEWEMVLHDHNLSKKDIHSY